MKNPIVHFEIPANDVQRAKKFYERTFGWKIKKFPLPEGEYFAVYTTEVGKNSRPKKPGAINGGLLQRKNPDQPFMNYISVNSIDRMLDVIQQNGGVVLMPKQEIGMGMGWIAA
ncbi:MAG TPA: VOC family protein, partial [Candidatus Nanoarchaeia archaeon]|nr:VOC family protein [Candidatus Nanoarchaeia archaeon]